MTAEQQTFDLIIVGAATAGATLACALADSGLRIALVDAREPFADPGPLADCEFDARVSAITPASRDIFRELGLWSAMADRRVSPYTAMQVWDCDGTGAIDFDARDIHADVLGHIVENRVMLEALHQRLAEQDNVTLVAPATVRALVTLPSQGTGGPPSPAVALTLADGRRLQGHWLVGADGGQSRVRELAGFPTRQWSYGQRAIVTTVRTERPHGRVARQCFMNEGVLAFLPLQTPAGDRHQRYCSIVWSLERPHAEALMQDSEAAFGDALTRAFEGRLGRVTMTQPRHAFALHQCHARDYVRDRVVLIGDAAHSIHPLAGQGANLGIKDARELAAVIREAQNKGRDWRRPAVMRGYQRRRMGPNLTMMALMEGFRHLFADQPPPLRWLRNTGLSRVDALPAVKNRLMREAMR